MGHVRVELPELVVKGKRLGRHINHDPRSLAYLVAEESSPASVSWDARIPILDQGNVGSCTGNATTGELGTGPFFDALEPRVQKILNESYAVDVYELATQLDPYPGTYPPTDTGSDGLSAAKAAVQLGDAVGYVHAVSIAGMHAMIQTGPFAIGMSWRSGCDTPDSNGVVKYAGRVRGGHEVCAVAYDSSSNLWKIRNSWSDSWGKDGYFYVSDADMVKILADSGDATQLVPLTAPAPVPTPVPTPSGTTLTLTADELTALDGFAQYPHHYRTASLAAKAYAKARSGA